MKGVLSVLRAALSRRRFEEGLAEEVRFHLEQYAGELVRSGLSPEEAGRRARLELGSLDNLKDDCRAARGLRLFDELQRDLRHAIRLVRKTPGFTATALLTLALCLGANLAIFAVVDSVLLRPLPLPAADRLVRVFNTYPRAGVPDDGCSVANYYERRGQLPAFSALAAFREGTAIVGEPGATERELVMRVTPDFFTATGVAPARGRAFTDEETTYETDGVAILTDAYWRQRLGADPDVIGRTIRVDGLQRVVVGVLPPEWSFLSSRARVYFPFSSNPEDRESARRHWGSSSHMIGRLAPGATVALAQSQLDAHNEVMERANPEAKAMADAGFRSVVVPLHESHVAAIRPTLLLLQAGAFSLLLIGAVNLVNLLLIRACGRAKELAVRQALGAGRGHIVREVMVETTLLTVGGGLLGLGVGAAGIRLLAALGAAHLPLGARIAFDARLALLALAGATVLGMALAVPIAWYSLRGHAAPALQSESRGSTSSRAAEGLRHAFIVAQIALAFVLLAGAGLLGRSLDQVMAISPGFRPEGVLSGQISLPRKGYPQGQTLLAFSERVAQEFGREPGVVAVGVATNVPLSGNSIKSAATLEGRTPKPGEPPHGHYSYSVGGDFFSVLGFSLREGRFLVADDSRRPERVCVVDEDFARRYWPEGGAVGHRLFQGSKAGPDAEAFTIVGVVEAVKQADLTDTEAQGAIYYPFGHRPDNALYVVARTTVPPESLGVALQDAVRRIDPELPVNDVRTMEARIAESLVNRRSPAMLAGLFSGVALLLAAVGTYGVLSFAVAQRSREIALRMVLGARPEEVRAQFVSLGLRLLALGMALGIAGAGLTGRAMQAVLFQVPSLHLATFASTGCILGVVALLACLVPSHRAARISPLEALADQ